MNEKHQEKLQDQILQLLDGDLDSAAAGQLDKELRGSSEARKLYIQLSTLHSALEEEGSAHSSNELEPVIPIERLLARQRRRVITNTLWASAAILILSFVILWFKMVPDSAPVANFQLSPDSAFTLSHANEEKAPEPPKSAPKEEQEERNELEKSVHFRENLEDVRIMEEVPGAFGFSQCTKHRFEMLSECHQRPGQKQLAI